MKISVNYLKWISRDRLILFVGYVLMFFYSMMYFLGLFLLDEMKNYKRKYLKILLYFEIDVFDFVDVLIGLLG